MRDNPIQFAVVREDPELEAELLAEGEVSEALLIASGGCTALTLGGRFPELRITLVDPNRAQLDLVERKLAALRAGERDRFNVGDDDPTGLNACGNFESLFRAMRAFLTDLVVPPDELRALFDPSTADGDRAALVERMVTNVHWRVAFEMFFGDPLLEAMFGPDATQHARRGSYPSYFRRLFERGLAAGVDNYFLHHVFLGCYLDRAPALPAYLTSDPPVRDFEMVHGFVEDVVGLGRFDFVSLSNITDWMPVDQVARLGELLARQLRPGARVMMRQLNNELELASVFGSAFRFDRERGQVLRARDRSLFYSAVHVAERVGT